MLRIIILFLCSMPLVASVICIVKHPIWVGILGIIGTLVLIVLACINKSGNAISGSNIKIENGSFIQS